MRIISKITNNLGIDGAIAYTLIARVIQGSGGLIVLALIALFLNSEEQGYYYTFGSIIAIQVFFELGLNSIITQYVAHEAAHLQFTSNFTLTGNRENLSRLSSLLRFCIKVFGLLSIVLFCVLTLVGFVFFSHFNKDLNTINWEAPWVLVSLSTSLMLLVNPILAFLEGLGKVKDVAKIRAVQQTSYILCIALVFIMNGGLYALGIASFVSFLVILVNLFFSYHKYLLYSIYQSIDVWRVNYIKEIFPYQWKIAISWISGYFIFQLFNPVLFATEGPKVAGQMGMTLAALNGILTLSLAWISTKIPLLSGLIAQKKYSKLDLVFEKTLKQSAIINFGALTLFMTALVVIRNLDIFIGGKLLGDRFLPYIQLLFMMIPIFLNQFTGAWATYLRCHKQEPFLINSITGALLSALSTLLLGNQFGLNGITVGYCIVNIILFPWGYYIYKSKKNEWHV